MRSIRRKQEEIETVWHQYFIRYTTTGIRKLSFLSVYKTHAIIVFNLIHCVVSNKINCNKSNNGGNSHD